MVRRATAALVLGLCGLGGAGLARAASTPLGELKLQATDPRGDVTFGTVAAFREGCEIGYRVTYQRAQAHPIKLRLHLELSGGPGSLATPWSESKAAGPGVAEGRIATDGCWAKRARRLLRVRTEIDGDPPRPEPPRAGKVFLGKVVFNQWGASGDIYYRHIQAWKAGCKVSWQLLHQRRTAARRRIRLKLTFENGEVLTPWMRSKEAGWREVTGEVETPGCFAEKTQTLRVASFESERY